MQRAFIIRPFGKKLDGAGKEIDFDLAHSKLFKPALDAVGLAGSTTGEIVDSGNIREDMFHLIIEADLVLCDITIHNANVFYELGIRHALRKKRSVLVKGEPVRDSTPFDILTDRYLAYDISDPGKAKEQLIDVLRQTLASSRETDSPIFKLLPTLPEVDPARIQIVPQEFTEEVARASAARSAGWLRLLAAEVGGLRFQWPALRLIGQAQWSIEDFVGAQATWDRVRSNDDGDVAANLALATLLERGYRRTKRLSEFEASQQAIERVLDGNRATTTERAEALALKGRNVKSRWRLELDSGTDLSKRRASAINKHLFGAYEAYRAAYGTDLNHYWSGLAALQMGTIAFDLSRDADWEDAFDDTTQADSYKAKLTRDLDSLRGSVPLAIKTALERLPVRHSERPWAAVSQADLIFLTEERQGRVAKAYRDAVVGEKSFMWNAAKGQLQLFVELGVRSELADFVVKDIDPKVGPPEPTLQRHVVAFSGHRIDEPGRAVPRFPESKEDEVRTKIRVCLAALKDQSMHVEVLASGAPGADILCHEVCKELGIPSTICLPMSLDVFTPLAFGRLDSWRRRFLDLVDSNQPIFLSTDRRLPGWLQASGVDYWERGNRWVVEMARSAASKVTAVAFWDEKEKADGPGGTGHFVELARAAAVRMVILKADIV